MSPQEQTSLVQAIRSEIVGYVGPIFQELKGDISEMKADIRVLKADVAVLKQDVAVLKQDVAVLKQDVAVLKSDMTVVKDRLTGVEGDISEIKDDLRGTEARLEIKINKNTLSIVGLTREVRAGFANVIQFEKNEKRIMALEADISDVKSRLAKPI